MKRNKLVLSSGILMIIGAVASLVAGVIMSVYVVQLVGVLESLATQGTGSSSGTLLFDDEFFYSVYLLALSLMVVIYVTEFVVYLVFGIKLVVKSAKKKELKDYKNLAVTAQILGYIGAGLSISSDMGVSMVVFALLLTSAILLSVALAKDNKEHKVMLDTNFGGYKEQVDLAKEPDSTTLDERSYAEDLTKKIQSLQELKNEGLLDNEEYTKLIHKVLGLESTDSEKVTVKKTRKTNTKGDKNEG